MWLYRYDWNQCPSITAMQINSDLATLLEKNNQLKSENQDLQQQLAISKNNNNAEMNIIRNELSENKYKLD